MYTAQICMHILKDLYFPENLEMKTSYKTPHDGCMFPWRNEKIFIMISLLSRDKETYVLYWSKITGLFNFCL